MAVTLGKRKRRAEAEAEKPKKAVAVTPARRESSDSSDGETARALFRRAFEAKFKPLEKVDKSKVKPVESEPEDEDLSESDWDGLSDEEDAVEVVRHVLPEFTREKDGSKKAFMVRLGVCLCY